MTQAQKQPFVTALIADHNVAAISRSSPHLIRRLLRHLDLKNIRTLVELGPADGVATKPILRALGPEARLLAVEMNHGFAQALRKTRDERLTVVEGDARQLPLHLRQSGLDRIDAVIASIPFTYLTPEERDELVANVKNALRPGGVFIIFHQYSWLMLPYLQKAFDDCRLEFEPLNVLPCFLMIARK